MLKIGLTGGIGSGKTTISKIFAILGIPIYYADNVAKQLMQTDTALIETLKSTFGNTIYNTNNELQPQILSKIVFKNPTELNKLNHIVHPAVLKHAEDWHNKQKNCPYTLKEAALLFESGSYRLLDKIIVVHAPLNIRIQRIMTRDNFSEEETIQRIKQQLPEEEKLKKADYIIHNQPNTFLIPQVLSIHQKLVQLSITANN